MVRETGPDAGGDDERRGRERRRPRRVGGLHLDLLDLAHRPEQQILRDRRDVADLDELAVRHAGQPGRVVVEERLADRRRQRLLVQGLERRRGQIGFRHHRAHQPGDPRSERRPSQRRGSPRAGDRGGAVGAGTVRTCSVGERSGPDEALPGRAARRSHSADTGVRKGAPARLCGRGAGTSPDHDTHRECGDHHPTPESPTLVWHAREPTQGTSCPCAFSVDSATKKAHGCRRRLSSRRRSGRSGRACTRPGCRRPGPASRRPKFLSACRIRPPGRPSSRRSGLRSARRS